MRRRITILVTSLLILAGLALCIAFVGCAKKEAAPPADTLPLPDTDTPRGDSLSTDTTSTSGAVSEGGSSVSTGAPTLPDTDPGVSTGGSRDSLALPDTDAPSGKGTLKQAPGTTTAHGNVARAKVPAATLAATKKPAP